MTLKEAIEKAGEGGFTRPCFKGQYLKVLSGGACFYDRNGEYIGPHEFPLEDVTATDWEIVHDEIIEVGEGDIVRVSDHDADMEIISVSANGKIAKGRECITFEFGTIAITDIIRKGPKVDTFEGVEIGCSGLSIEGDAFRELKKDGKTYTMTLTEESNE